MVLAITKDNVDAPPTLFKTYDSSAAFDTSTVWQVARATSAAKDFFKSIKVGRDDVEFIDSNFRYNNPCDILIQEAQKEFPKFGTMKVLSIGAGLGNAVTINDKRLSIITALQNMATLSTKVAANMAIRYGDTGEYYRFNVDEGLQDITLFDWEGASKIPTHTRNYLAENERKIKKFINEFTRQSETSAQDIEARLELNLKFGESLQADGRIKQAIKFLQEHCRWNESQYGEDHPSRLKSEHALAAAYRADGQIGKAIELLEYLVTVQGRTVAEHPDRLASQHELARAYKADGQIPKAVELFEYVATVRGRTLPENHPDQLASQYELAGAYGANGRISEALGILEHMITV